LYAFVNVLLSINFVWSVHIFSTIVFVIFTFFPVIGYIIAKQVGAPGQSNSYLLLCYGAGIGCIEKALYQYNMFSFEHNNFGALFSFALMFSMAYIPFPSKVP